MNELSRTSVVDCIMNKLNDMVLSEEHQADGSVINYVEPFGNYLLSSDSDGTQSAPELSSKMWQSKHNKIPNQLKRFRAYEELNKPEYKRKRSVDAVKDPATKKGKYFLMNQYNRSVSDAQSIFSKQKLMLNSSTKTLIDQKMSQFDVGYEADIEIDKT